MKLCTKCGETKAFEAFSKKKKTLQSMCKVCASLYRRDFYKKKMGSLGKIVNAPKIEVDTKTCFVCKIEKSIEEFWKTKYKAYRSQCIECDKESTKKTRLKNQVLLAEIKNKPCKDCGVTYPSYVMDFDHLGSDKYKNVSLLVTSKKKMLEEITKCDLVCANCHRERTHKRQNANVVESEDTTLSKSVAERHEGSTPSVGTT